MSTIEELKRRVATLTAESVRVMAALDEATRALRDAQATSIGIAAGDIVRSTWGSKAGLLFRVTDYAVWEFAHGNKFTVALSGNKQLKDGSFGKQRVFIGDSMPIRLTHTNAETY